MAPESMDEEEPVHMEEKQVGEAEDGPSESRTTSCFTDERGNLKAVNLVVRHPCLIFWVLLCLCIGIAFLLQILVFRTVENGNPFTDPEFEFDLKDERSIQFDSFRLARDEVQQSRSEVEAVNATILKQSEFADITYWVFESETPEGLFGSAESIEAMKEAFDIFLDDEGYEEYCLLDYSDDDGASPECRTPLSPLTMYYASSWDSEKVASVIESLKDPERRDLFNLLGLCYVYQLNCDRVPELTPEEALFASTLGLTTVEIVSTWDMKGELVENFTQATELASYLVQIDVFKRYVDFGYDKDFSIDNQKSQYSRGVLYWGGPLDDRASGETVNDELDDTENDDRKRYIIDNYLEEMDDVASDKTYSFLNAYYFMIALINDVILAIVIRDALLALFSLAFVFFWLRINTGSWFLAGVGLFEIFFSIPIAWFLFTVVFQIKLFATLNSLAIFIVAAIGADDIFVFMDAYKQSKIRNPENLVDLETRMSWVYRRTGSAMLITSATTCCAFLCTLITPLPSIQSFGIFAAFVILVDYVLVMSLFCTAVVIYHDRYEDRGCFGCCCPCDTQNPDATAKARTMLEENEEEVKGDWVSEFFRNKFSAFIQVPLHRLVLGVIFVTWLSIACWQTSLIEPTKESEQFLNENHPLQKSINILNKEFPTATEDSGLKVYYAFGLEKVDRSGVNRLLDPTFFGEPQFVDDFDFSPQCQTELVSFCDTLKTDSKYKGLIKRNAKGLGTVYCFIEELAAYNVNGNLDDCEYVEKGEWKNETWQVDSSDLSGIMDGFLSQKSCYGEDDETISARYDDEMGWNGSSLKYAAISVESDVLTPFGLDAEETTRKEYDQFIALAEEMNKLLSESCQSDVIVTDLDNKFVFMNNQAIYVQVAWQSAVLGVVIAFVVLLISTRVFHLAFFASISITSVLVSVVGTMVMLGWNLGSIEAILIGVIAGFSVDYVVHLAHAYEVAEGDTSTRIKEAFSDLGISVFNGMVTSVAASIPLFFCQLQFFAKFGTFLCLTIAYSWIFANFGFMSLLAQLKIPVKNHATLSC